ncbi:cytochrome P450 [Serendipita vermifera]|nr:cytochrome P450 [Serendipita vermifera]
MKAIDGLVDVVTSKVVDSPFQTGAVSLAIASLGYLIAKKLHNVIFKDRSAHSYPPGPPRSPLVGALTSFPKDHFYQRFREWAVTYGDVVYAPVLGTNMVILNSYDAAHEFLSKRPNTTGGRLVSYLLTDLMNLGWTTTLIQPGFHHSNQRKMMRRAIGPQRIETYNSSIELAVAELMVELETFRGNPKRSIYRTVGRMEMGTNLIPWNVELTGLVNEAFFGFWLVDFFHFCKELSKEAAAISDKVRYTAYTRGLDLYKSGMLGQCILNDLLEEFGDDKDVRDATATTGAITGFLLSLFLCPEICQRVYEEIQSITHGVRLPNVTDRVNLPYTEAVFKESLRFRPFSPLGIPHVSTEDEVFRGYLIPKGTIIHQCEYAILHDARVWEEPEVFKPERFLEPGASGKPNPLTVVFGYGSRVCPGMYLGDKVAFHLVATIVSLFKVVHFEGKNVPDPAELEWEDTAVQQPINFECRFVVRDEKAQHLLKVVGTHE